MKFISGGKPIGERQHDAQAAQIDRRPRSHRLDGRPYLGGITITRAWRSEAVGFDRMEVGWEWMEMDPDAICHWTTSSDGGAGVGRQGWRFFGGDATPSESPRVPGRARLRCYEVMGFAVCDGELGSRSGRQFA